MCNVLFCFVFFSGLGMLKTCKFNKIRSAVFNSGVQLLNEHIVAAQKAFATQICNEFKCDIISKKFIRLGFVFILFPSLTPLMNGLQIYTKQPIILWNIVHMLCAFKETCERHRITIIYNA